MKTINEVRLLGRLGKDAEVKKFANGGSITKLIIATENAYKDKITGDYVKETEWTTAIVRGSKAPAASKLRKGQAVEINGRLKTRSFEVNGEKRYSTEVLTFEARHVDGQQPTGEVNGNRIDNNQDDFLWT